MSPDARLLCGLTLILAPGIVYRGLTVLGVVTNGKFGTPGPQNLLPSQVSLYRAGHAHAGALTLLSLFLQVALDYALLPHGVLCPSDWRLLPLHCLSLEDFLLSHMFLQCGGCFTLVRRWSC